jgi:hypothetical protein
VRHTPGGRSIRFRNVRACDVTSGSASAPAANARSSRISLSLFLPVVVTTDDFLARAPKRRWAPFRAAGGPLRCDDDRAGLGNRLRLLPGRPLVAVGRGDDAAGQLRHVSHVGIKAGTGPIVELDQFNCPRLSPRLLDGMEPGGESYDHRRHRGDRRHDANLHPFSIARFLCGARFPLASQPPLDMGGPAT